MKIKDKNQQIEYEIPEQATWMVREGAEVEYDASQKFTYEDYCMWSDDERWELIDGYAHRLEAPNRYHQKISMNLVGELYIHLKGKICEVYAAPFDVRLNVGEGEDTVVQPDILVICDRDKLDHKGAKGVPELVIEILSPSTTHHDRVRKFEKYIQYGVKEYWIVDPLNKNVEVYMLGIKDLTIYHMGSKVASFILRRFSILVEDVFADD